MEEDVLGIGFAARLQLTLVQTLFFHAQQMKFRI